MYVRVTTTLTTRGLPGSRMFSGFMIAWYIISGDVFMHMDVDWLYGMASRRRVVFLSM